MGKVHGSLARAGKVRGPNSQSGKAGQEEEAPWPCPQEDAIQPPFCHSCRRIWKEERAQFL
ncbi:hypothetical protein OIU78_029978 [Salix suchowensis]|nr:hypothetical protein OIU78_029978 [Salix suchowensis]